MASESKMAANFIYDDLLFYKHFKLISNTELEMMIKHPLDTLHLME